MKPTFDLTDKVPLKKVSLLLFVPGNSQVFYSTDISNIKPLSQENRHIRTEIEKKSGGKIRMLRHEVQVSSTNHKARMNCQRDGRYKLATESGNRTTEKGYN